MLFYKKGRFHIGGMSFALPDNINIVTKDSELVLLDGFIYTDTEKKVQVIIDSYDIKGQPWNYFKMGKFLKYDEVDGEIIKGSIGNLTGAYAYTKGDDERYFELIVELPENIGYATCLLVFVEVLDKNMSIKEAANHPVVTNFIASMKKD